MLCGNTMWHFVLLAVACGLLSVVVCIQVHEDVMEDPTTTAALPVQVPSSGAANLAGNSSAATGREATSSALSNQDSNIIRQNHEGNSSRIEDNTPPNNSSSFTHHIHIPDTNSQPSSKQFVPSPQLNTWNEKVTLSPEYNHFQPLRQGPRYKVLHTKVQPVSFKHTQVLMPPTGEQKGHFVWVPYTAETTTIRNTELPPTIRDPWRWNVEQDNSVGDRTNGGAFPFGDGIKMWQDINRKPSRDWPYPFEISDNPFETGWTTEKVPLETTTLEMEDPQSKSKAHLPTGFSGKNKSPWKKLAHILTAAIPIGLLISALTPHVVYVNPNNTYSPTVNPSISLYPGRLRSLDDGRSQDNLKEAEEARKMKNPLMDFISMFSEANNDVGVNCENRVFCELSRMGAYRDSDVLQKMLWRIANETPDTVAKKTGLIAIFRAIRENKCAIFHCNMHTSTLSLQNADNE